MVIPRFVRQALRGEPITVYGDGTPSRCFCDVRDVVQAIIGLISYPEAPGRIYNIGGTDEIAIDDLAARVKLIARRASSIGQVPYAEAYAPGFEDMQRRVPDIGRIHALLAWRPRRSLDEILEGVMTYKLHRLATSTSEVVYSR